MTRAAIYTEKQDNPFTKRGSFGASEESQHLYNLYDSALESFRETISIYTALAPIVRAKEELAAVFTEASEDNWNGEGARAVTLEGYELAQEFLSLLPASVPEPEISADPDSDLSIEWYGRGNRVVSISIGETGKLTFAAVIGNTEYHGVDYFNCSIPPRLLGYIFEVVGD